MGGSREITIVMDTLADIHKPGFADSRIIYPRIDDRGSRIRFGDRGSYPGITDQIRGSRIRFGDRGSRIGDRGSRIEDQGSWITERGSRIGDRS